MSGFKREEYLGDGLYASYDGFMVSLRAPRESGDHWVGLEPDIMFALFRFCEKVYGIKIKIEKVEKSPGVTE